jgi:UPF0716 protein FxsA
MLLALIVVFLVLPFVELAVIIQVAGWLGTGPTIALLVVESILGAWLCKREGAGVLRRINDQLNAGQLPKNEVVDGGLILLAGALMVTPGFLTDILGFLLLTPPTRAVFREIVLARLRRRLDNAMAGGGPAGFRFVRVSGFDVGGSPFTTHDGTVINVDSRDTDGGFSRTGSRRDGPPQLGGGV